ncbi:hypothetical protein Cgig2_024001 [Carnegiea gigantea]|uniref:Uncharacterized protein n=1 Tax=Carnegiea gigantea TaxID=171969 RepID=A0A9Q1QG19_9CARY|nr:hypothetical protein Cgig2_024001 [Carnegiea gigantea]
MKTVSGVVLSSKPVSLYRAARVLSKFVASDNGASPAFTAYLKRASASFDELVQLRKELKGSSARYRGKKSLPDGNIAEDTVNSVKKPGQDGLYNEGKFGVSGRKEHNMGKRDEVEAREVEGDGCFGIRMEKRNSEGNVGRDSVDVRGGEKKMKKQRGEGGEIELINEKERSYGDLDAVDANGIKDDGGSKETKKKKKRHKGERAESDNALKKHDQDGNLNQDDINGEATDVVENGVSDGKKHKKNKKGKEERESSSTGVAELMDISNGGSEHDRIKTESNEGKKKKRSREEKEKESGIKVEAEEADNKESRKGKHKRSGHGGLDDSEEQHRSKKKSRKNERSPVGNQAGVTDV